MIKEETGLKGYLIKVNEDGSCTAEVRRLPGVKAEYREIQEIIRAKAFECIPVDIDGRRLLVYMDEDGKFRENKQVTAMFEETREIEGCSLRLIRDIFIIDLFIVSPVDDEGASVDIDDEGIAAVEKNLFWLNDGSCILRTCTARCD